MGSVNASKRQPRKSSSLAVAGGDGTKLKQRGKGHGSQNNETTQHTTSSSYASPK